jgi:nucleoside-diphosphate-sugar epimerase
LEVVIKALVTGAGSYVARSLIYRLTALGYSVRGFDVGQVEDPIEGVQYLTGDVTRAGVLSEMARGVDQIFHLSRMSGQAPRGPTKGVSAPLAVVIKLMTLAESLGVKSFVYLSGAEVYGAPKDVLIDEATKPRPINRAGRESLSIENYLVSTAADRDMAVVILRPAPIIGWGTPEGLFPSLSHALKSALLGRPLFLIGRGNHLVQYVDVEDLASAMVRVVREPQSGSLVLNVAAEDIITQRELCEFIIESQHTASSVVSLPEAALPMVGILRRMGIHPVGTDGHFFVYPQTIIDPEKAKRLLNLTPKRITESVAETFGYWRETEDKGR